MKEEKNTKNLKCSKLSSARPGNAAGRAQGKGEIPLKSTPEKHTAHALTHEDSSTQSGGGAEITQARRRAPPFSSHSRPTAVHWAPSAQPSGKGET